MYTCKFITSSAMSISDFINLKKNKLCHPSNDLLQFNSNMFYSQYVCVCLCVLLCGGGVYVVYTRVKASIFFLLGFLTVFCSRIVLLWQELNPFICILILFISPIFLHYLEKLQNLYINCGRNCTSLRPVKYS